MTDLFDTDEKIQLAISAFSGLLTSPGWKLIEQILDENIKLLQEQLESGVEGETKEDVDLVRYKLAISKETRNLPVKMIEKLQSPEGTVPNSDPFLSIDELKKNRKVEI